MKTKFTSIMLMLVFPLSVANGKNINATFYQNTFYSAETGPFAETYLSVKGNSVVYAKNANGMYQAAIEVTVTYRLNNEIKYFDKYNLLSPEVKDTNETGFNFLDQQRVQLANGRYVFEITITDKNSANKPLTAKQELNIEYYPNIAAISDIELVESYKKTEQVSPLSKSGFDIVPYVNNFYPETAVSLKFYAEIYNTDKVLTGEPYLVSYFIQSYESKRVMEKFRNFAKQNAKPVNALLGEFPVADLPSGNYNLVIEARNKQNDIIAFREVFFQRSNAHSNAEAGSDYSAMDVSNTFASQYSNKDSLTDFIKSLRPVSNTVEINFQNNQLKTAETDLMQKYFYDFWQKRSPENPEKAWLDYNAMVKIVNENYSTLNKRGYETDRGRVYLQYGAPDVIQREYREPSAYPYEIWQFYKIGNFSNKKFVFYNPDLVTNDFALIHSDMQGEIFDNQWELKVHKRDTQIRDMDRDIRINSFDSFGNRIDQNYNNPR